MSEGIERNNLGVNKKGFASGIRVQILFSITETPVLGVSVLNKLVRD